jgi:hypothetical protein
MCLILDANCLHKVFPVANAEFIPINEALMTGGAKLAFGGSKLTTEYALLTKAWRMVVALDRAGKMKKIKNSLVDAKEAELSDSGQLASDDPHIIALAMISGVRLLCSHDQDLHTDFTNPAVLHPRGCVYQNASHKHLIRKYC